MLRVLQENHSKVDKWKQVANDTIVWMAIDNTTRIVVGLIIGVNVFKINFRNVSISFGN